MNHKNSLLLPIFKDSNKEISTIQKDACTSNNIINLNEKFPKTNFNNTFCKLFKSYAISACGAKCSKCQNAKCEYNANYESKFCRRNSNFK